MIRMAVLNNLRSGRGAPRVALVLDLLRSHPEVLHLETETADSVPEALAQFEQADAELLVINGGDGTLQGALTEILADHERSWCPALAPMRAGRTNMAATDFGSAHDPVKGLATLIAAARDGSLEQHRVHRPVLRVDLSTQGGPHYGMFFGAGMLYRAVQLTSRHLPRGRAQGVFGAGVVTGTLVARTATGRVGGVLEPDKMQVAIDDDPPESEELRLVMATTLRQLFLRLRPFWGREQGPLRFTTIAADAQHLGRAVWGLARGRPPVWATPETGYRSRNCATVSFRLDCGMTIDGELLPPDPGRTVTVSTDDRIRFFRA